MIVLLWIILALVAVATSVIMADLIWSAMIAKRTGTHRVASPLDSVMRGWCYPYLWLVCWGVLIGGAVGHYALPVVQGFLGIVVLRPSKWVRPPLPHRRSKP